MIQWSTLNKGVVEPEVAPEEAKIDRLYQLYQQAILLQRKQKYDDAADLYREIIADNALTDDMSKIANSKKNITALPFLVYKNYAIILEHSFTSTKDPEAAKEAIAYYTKAIEQDASECSLWYRLGSLANVTGNTRLARFAFEKGFFANMDLKKVRNLEQEIKNLFLLSQLSPMQWRCMEGLCKVLVAIGDFQQCQYYLDTIASVYPGWSLCDQLKQDMANRAYEPVLPHEQSTLSLSISELSWESVTDQLISVYRRICSGDEPSFTASKRVQIELNLAEESSITNEQSERETSPSAMDIDEAPESKTTTLDMMEVEQSMEEDQSAGAEQPAGAEQSPAVEPTSEEQPVAVERQADRDQPMEVELSTEEQTPFDVDPPTETQQPETEKAVEIDKTMEWVKSAETEQPSETTQPLEVGQPVTIEQAVNDYNNTDAISPENVMAPNETQQDQTTIDTTEDVGETEENSLKRKNSEGEVLENDEEESEDKRATLRASKRKKEQLENEESARRKMLEEENRVNEVIEDLFSQCEFVPALLKRKIWYAATVENSTINPVFWEWFESKITQLDSRHTWEFEKKLANASVESKAQGRRYIIFKAYPQQNETPDQHTLVECVESINSCNSGIMDCLSRLGMLLLEKDAESSLSPPLVDTMMSCIEVLQYNFAHQLFDKAVEKCNMDYLKYCLRVSERLVDKLIHKVVVSNEAPPAATNKRKNAKQSEEATIQDYTKLCNSWIAYFERILLRYETDKWAPESTLDTESIPQDTLKALLLRYWFLKAKLAQCDENVDEAFALYKRCLQELENMKAQDNEDLKIQIFCAYDSVIDIPSLKSKLSSLDIGKQLVAAKKQFDEKNYQAAIDILEEQTKVKDLSAHVSETNEIFKILTLCYTKVSDFKNACRCSIRILCHTVSELLTFGSGVDQSSATRKEADTQFLLYLQKISRALQDIVSFHTENEIEWIELLDDDSIDTLMVVHRLVVMYMYRHPDFIYLINNFENGVSERHVPSRVTRTAEFNNVIGNSWYLLSTLVERGLPDNSFDKLCEFVRSVHDDLGEREICGSGKRIFLTNTLRIMSKSTEEEYKTDVYQCFHCLYGVHLQDGPGYVEDHNAAHQDLSTKAAEMLFSLVVPSIMERLDRGAFLKPDQKEVIDSVSGLFSTLPAKNNLIIINKTAIKSYINRDIDLVSPLRQRLWASNIPAVTIDPARSKISPVYFKIFLIRGRLLRMQIKNRNKVNTERTMDDLEDAAELFTNHIILNPTDAKAWIDLGICLSQLADEELIWSASNITSHKKRIAQYQKKAYHAFWQAWYLSKMARKKMKNAMLQELYINFGLLIYSMACPPMSMEAFKQSTKRAVMSNENELYAVSQATAEPTHAYKLALAMFTKVLQCHPGDKTIWRCYYMCGKCFNKIDRSPKEVLSWYVEAVRRAPSKQNQGNQEKILEPVYKLCAALAKYLYQGKIQPNEVLEYLGEAKTGLWGEGNRETDTGGQLEHAAAYDAIFKQLMEVRKIDKKGWHHRPIYQLAWLYYHVYNDPKKATTELLQLFTLKSNVKAHINIWKPGFERPGKHFEYAHQYTMFLIRLATETQNLPLLANICEKLKKAQTVLLNWKSVMEIAKAAHDDVAATSPWSTVSKPASGTFL